MFIMSTQVEPPLKVSRIVHKHSKVAADLLTKKLKATDWNNQLEVSNLISWINGIAIPEKNKDVKQLILKVRSKVQDYRSYKFS